MTIELSNIIKDFKKRLFKKSEKENFVGITWLQEKILKHQEDRQIKTIKLGELSLKYKRPYEVLHTYTELFVDEIYRFETKEAKPFIIDAGANIGLSVLYFKSLYPSAEVIAFEPDEDNCKLLRENISLNNLKDVTVEQAAVWIKDETLYFNSAGSQGSKIAEEKDEQKNRIKVEAIRLADIIAQRQIDFLKIDIEGAEFGVLKDCANALGKVKHLFVEYHGKVNETEKLVELLSIVQKAGFNVYIKMAADMLKFPFVNHTTNGSFDVQLNIFCYR